MTRRRWLLSFALFLSLVACLGPKPVVREVRVKALAGAEPSYALEIVVENTGQGEGQTGLQARMIDVRTGHTYQESAKLELKGHEVTTKTLQIRAPIGEYRTEVTVEYPEM